MATPLPQQLSIDAVGFSKKIMTVESTGSRNLYMSANKDAGFSRAQNLTLQCCPPDTPLVTAFDLSEPKQGNMSRWSLDVDVPVGSALYEFLDGLNKLTREEVRGRAAECFPQMKTEKMSDDQLNMCYIPCFKAAEPGCANGKMKLKIIMPPNEEELSRMSAVEAQRRQEDATCIVEVSAYEPPSAENPEGVFKHETSDPSILKQGCKVMPIVTTSGVWLNKSQCGISFVCTSICVWRAPAKQGVSAFNLGGVTAAAVAAGRKRPRDPEDDAASHDGYAPYTDPYGGEQQD